MLEFNLFSKELPTYLGCEFQDISLFLICSLNAALVIHTLLTRWNKAFVVAVLKAMVSDYENVCTVQ